jgi:hypothetical protein
MVDLPSLAALAVGLAAGVALVEATIRRSDVGAAVVLSLLVVQEFAKTSFTFGVGPFTVHANDLAMVLLAGCAVARLLRTHRPSFPQRLLIGLGLLVLFSIVRGTEVAGVNTAINESRKLLGFVVASLYFSTIEPRQDLLDRIVRIWLAAAAALCVLTLVRWGAGVVGVTGGMLGGRSAGGLRAAIPSDPALVVGQAAVLVVLLFRDRRAGLLRYASLAFLVFAALLQHRTVWIVVAAGLLAVLFQERMLAIRTLSMLAVGLAVAASLLFTVVDIGGDPLVEELTDSAVRTDTFEWRVAGWEALLRDSGPETIDEALIGRPFGSGWERRFSGITVGVSPHNYYLEVFLRVGLAGIASFVGVYIYSLRDRRGVGVLPSVAATTDARPAVYFPSALVSIVGVQLIYYVTYTGDMSQGLLLGLACAIAGQRIGAGRPIDAPESKVHV